MMYKLLMIAMLILTACGCGSTKIAVDNTPAWDQNNRFAVEQKVDCNTATHSVGLSGCAFYSGQLGGNLVIPALYDGTLDFQSYNCKSFTLTASKNANNIIPIRDIYIAANADSCSFGITRTIVVNGVKADHTMMGRFFLKILPADQTLTKLKFSIGRDTFDGVGWHQRVSTANDPVLTIRPTGQRGIFKIRCKDKLVYRYEYTSAPFEVVLNSKESCDYEMTAVNEDNADNESATYMHIYSPYTQSLSVPSVSTKSGKTTFSFNDKDATGSKPVVIGVKIGDGAICANTNKCTAPSNQTLYTVRAVTGIARYFLGFYSPTTKTWEVK